MKNAVTGAIREALQVTAVFIAVALAFTMVSVLTSDIHFKIGIFRPLSAIPPHLAALAGVGLAVGIVACLFSMRFSLKLILLSIVLTLLFDLDHLPSAVGIAQPIRPAHSLLFLGIVILAELVILRKPLGTAALIGAAFLGHIATDSGVFPLLYPFSLHYFQLGSTYPWLYLAAFVLAAMAGVLTRFPPRLLNFSNR
ncbi:MAG: hypothetical protein OK422_00210 [Thaumarchaeota archaeon]|nr:hypothetical protein [Nitrososphaerota archaeon]